MVLVIQLCPTLWDPMGCSLTDSCPWDFLGKDTGVGCHSLPQGIFLTQGSNPGLLHCRQILYCLSSIQFSCSVMPNSLLTHDCSTPGLPVHLQLPELAQTHVHRVGDAIQPSHPLSCPSPPAFNLFQHQGLFQWVSSLHQVAKVLEFQLQHQSFQWIFRTDFL